jgi:hypothetical protein
MLELKKGRMRPIYLLTFQILVMVVVAVLLVVEMVSVVVVLVLPNTELVVIAGHRLKITQPLDTLRRCGVSTTVKNLGYGVKIYAQQIMKVQINKRIAFIK